MEQLNSIVDFEMAELLKEKGFDEPTTIWRQHGDGISGNVEGKRDYYNRKGNVYISLPTIAQTIDWIYDKHGVWINVSPVFEYNDEREDYLTLQGFQYYITTIVDNKNDVSIADKEIKNSQKEAYIEAIKHTLLNLI